MKKWSVYKKTKLRRDLDNSESEVIYEFTVGEKVTALERRVNDAGQLMIRCEVR